MYMNILLLGYEYAQEGISLYGWTLYMFECILTHICE